MGKPWDEELQPSVGSEDPLTCDVADPWPIAFHPNGQPTTNSFVMAAGRAMHAAGLWANPHTGHTHHIFGRVGQDSVFAPPETPMPHGGGVSSTSGFRQQPFTPRFFHNNDSSIS